MQPASIGRPRGALRLRATELVWGTRTYVMAIVNATPDSFSGDGTNLDVEAAVRLGEIAAEAGADIVDVGGESTRPGAASVSVSEELSRVIPVVGALRGRIELPISIDTSKRAVADAALDAGADMVNDVWGLQHDPELAELVADRGVPLVIMHNSSHAASVRVEAGVGAHYVDAPGADVVDLVVQGLRRSLSIAGAAGVLDDALLIDPGIGFGKTVKQNLELIDRIGELRSLGLPVLVGPSRKSFIGLALDLPPGDRLEGTAAAVAVSIVRGADIVRVHDVRAMVRVARMTDALVRRGDPLATPTRRSGPPLLR